ncbi:transposase [Anaerococcus vaginalis]|uniref:transposase n=1 Tax=Anaerococcus vaginalis TaxID=33037 RepID=UPI003F68FA69
MVSVEQLVPKNHILRKIDKHIDFNFLYDLVVLIKLVILQYFFNINSMRQTIREVEVNLASSVLRTGLLR